MSGLSQELFKEREHILTVWLNNQVYSKMESHIGFTQQLFSITHKHSTDAASGEKIVWRQLQFRAAAAGGRCSAGQAQHGPRVVPELSLPGCEVAHLLTVKCDRWLEAAHCGCFKCLRKYSNPLLKGLSHHEWLTGPQYSRTKSKSSPDGIWEFVLWSVEKWTKVSIKEVKQ